MRSFRRPGRFCCAILAAILAACGDVSGPRADRSEQFLFVSTRVSAEGTEWPQLQRDIFRMDVEGKQLSNVTASPVQQYRSLSASADGRRIAYLRTEGCYGVWVMDADGGGARKVAGDDEFRCIHRPRISPDGSRIAMTSSRDRLGWVVWAINTDGGGIVNVSGSLVDSGSSWLAGWSPDGRIVFHHVPPGAPPYTITTYIANADGSNVQPLFDRAGDHSPAWSPDGSRLAFISDRDGTQRPWVMNVDATGLRRLSDLPGDAIFEHPLSIIDNAVSPWSPDGSRIVFANSGGLYSVRPDGTGHSELVPPSMSARFNGWSRSGTWLAFTSSAAGSQDIYVMAPDGSQLRNLTASSAHDHDAFWIRAR
jgi:TolB protein